MRNKILALSTLCILLFGCATPQAAGQSANPSMPDKPGIAPDFAAVTTIGAETNALPDALIETYYLSSEDPVYSYLQNSRIQKFFNMWLSEYTGEDIEADWNYETIAPVQLLDHNFKSIARSGEEYYTCTYSTDDGRCGYIIVMYGEGGEGPFIKKWSLHESTPFLYDLRANSQRIAASLNETDIDLSTATALRAEWIDTDKNRGDRIILFTDGKNDKYVCFLGNEDFAVEKQ